MPKNKKALLIVIVCVLIIIAVCASLYWLMNHRDFQLAGKIVSRVETNRKVVALTFDDGPTDKTPQILKILDELGVKCTFFLTGRQIEENPGFTRAIAQAGHQIGNHSYSHERMIFKSKAFIDSEIDTTNSLIRETGYEGEIVFRPPYCKKLLLLPAALEERGMITVTCDTEPESQLAGGSAAIAEYALEHAHEGSIILLHVMYDSTHASLGALPRIVNGLREKGYDFVTINELLALCSDDLPR